MLYYKTISKKTLGLLKRIQNIPDFGKLRLVGGTGLALQYGHWRSADIDLFGEINSDSLEIVDRLNKLGAVKTIRISKMIKIFSVDDIKVDIVHYPYPWLSGAIKENGIILAEDKDIAAMKLSAITNRGTKKNFIDLYFLLRKYTLGELIGFYERKYHDGSVFLLLKSLLYFDDAEDENMPEMLTDVKWDKIKERIISETLKF